MPYNNFEIVLVEDDQYDAELLMRVFKKNDFVNKVVLLKDGVEALDYLLKDKGQQVQDNGITPKIIFLDLKMPRVDGIEVLRRLKSDDRTKEIPVIILTGSKEERDLKNAHSLGVTSYLTKPLKSEQFTLLMSELGTMLNVSKKKVRILVIEDNAEDAELLKRELHKSGFNFTMELAEDKTAFQDALDKFIPDIILADYSLPGFGGLFAMHMARQRFPDVPVIIVSGAIGEETAIETLKNGATDYVLKSRLSRLGPVVNRALQESERIAERNKAENALKVTQFAIDKIGDACIWLSPDAHNTYVNDTACKMLGYSREELLSMRISDYSPMLVTADSWAKHLDSLKSQGSMTFETEFKKKNGEMIPVEINTNYIVFDHKEYIIAIARNITERKNAEKELIEAKEQAELYLDLMGHDISNMHQIIMGQLELAQEIINEQGEAGSPQ